MTAYPEVLRTCVLSIVSASLANALAHRVAHIDPRRLVTFYPRESATLLLAAQRINRWYGPSALAVHIRAFEVKLGKAKLATIRFAESYFLPAMATDIAALSASWSTAACECLALVRNIHALLELYGLENEPGVMHELEASVAAIANGLWPVIDERGQVNIPDWADQRGSERVTFRIPARLKFGDRMRAVLIRDISAVGLGMDCRAGLPRGVRVTVEIGTSRRLEGTIAWSSGGRAGVVLNRPLHGSDPRMAFCARARATSYGDHD